MRSLFFPSLPVFLLSAALAPAAIVLPTVADDSGSFVDSGLGVSTANMVNGAGLTSALSNGDSLATAQATNHVYGGGFIDSYVSLGNRGDDFFVGAAPVIVFDLGSDQPLSDIILWQYENNGGPGLDNQGNQASSIDLQVNTDAQGFAAFAGPVTSITMLPVEDNDGTGGNDLGGVNAAQTFSLTGTGRYVQMTITDNYRGIQGITVGGDRVGVGEVAFNVIPEPSTVLLGALGLLGLLRRRRV